MKDGKEINQRTFMHNPWAQTTIWGLARGGGGEREKEQEHNSINTKTKKNDFRDNKTCYFKQKKDEKPDFL